MRDIREIGDRPPRVNKRTCGKSMAMTHRYGGSRHSASPSNYPVMRAGRDVAGKWGVVGAEDAEANNQALKDGSRLLSAYILKDGKTKIWVITEAEDDNGNRAATTLILPTEY